MKKILVIIALMVALPTVGMAQQGGELSEEMNMFKQYCKRVCYGVAKHDADWLGDCISQWTPKTDDKEEEFIYRDTKIKYAPIDFLDVDVSNEVSLEGHFRFMPSYVDTLIANDFEPVEVAEASAARAVEADGTPLPTKLRNEGYNCLYTIRALKPRSKGTYLMYDCRGDMELFVAAENGGRINLRVKNKSTEQTLIDASPEGKPITQLKWQMAEPADMEVQVDNLGDKAISFIIVRN